MKAAYVFLIIGIIIIVIIIAFVLVYKFLLVSNIYYSCDTTGNCFANSSCTITGSNCILNDNTCGGGCMSNSTLSGQLYSCEGSHCINRTGTGCNEVDISNNCFPDSNCSNICGVTGPLTYYYQCNGKVCQSCGLVKTATCFLTNSDCNSTCNPDNNSCIFSTPTCLGMSFAPLVSTIGENDSVINTTPVVLLVACLPKVIVKQIPTFPTPTIVTIPFNPQDPNNYVYLVLKSGETKSIFEGGTFNIFSATTLQPTIQECTLTQFSTPSLICAFKLSINGTVLVDDDPILILVNPNGGPAPGVILPPFNI